MGNSELDAKWDQALGNPGAEIEIGRIVVCDCCNTDYTNSQRAGGFIYQSRAICPACAGDWMAAIISNGEQRYIKAAAQDGESFADFVRAYRGPNSSISVGPMRRMHE